MPPCLAHRMTQVLWALEAEAGPARAKRPCVQLVNVTLQALTLMSILWCFELSLCDKYRGRDDKLLSRL
jgi:hypothetical protein